MGGYAIKKVGTIKREDIDGTIDYLCQLTDIPKSDLYPLGSVGKVDISSDIDLAISRYKHRAEEIHEHLISILEKPWCTYNKGTKVYSYGIPISGNLSKGYVQVDLMYTHNIDWAEFAYFSDPSNSKYKGAVRTMLLMGVAATINCPQIDYYEYDEETGALLIRAGRTFDPNEGVRRICQYRPKKKRGKGYIKSMKTISEDELRKMFPHAKFDWAPTVHHPPSALEEMFGTDQIRPKHVRTAEQVLKIIYNRFDEERQQAIFEKAATRVTKGKFDLPSEIEAYVK